MLLRSKIVIQRMAINQAIPKRMIMPVQIKGFSTQTDKTGEKIDFGFEEVEYSQKQKKVA